MAVASLFEDLLDQYKIEQHVAQKRYTDLYQAYDVDDDRLVRLDILRAEFAEDASLAGRFISRARALAQVRHPNIAQVLHVGKSPDGVPYVAQSAVDGYPLTYRLEQLAQRNSPVNPIYALNLVRQLGDALLLAERLEIFHYDLQPDNVLLKNVTLPNDENVVLIDLFVPLERRNNTAAPAGTSAYLSPEQRAGRDVTAAGHVYSLGAILFHLLAGRQPGGAVTIGETTLGRVFGRATGLERERHDLAPATYALVNRSLRQDARGRFADIESFRTALDAALSAEEVRLSASTGRTPADERRPLAWLLPLAILALLLAVGAVAARGLLARDAGPALAPTALVVAAIDSPETPTIAPTDPPLTAAPVVADTATVAATPAPTDLAPSATATPTPTATATIERAVPTLAPTTPPIVRVVFNVVNLRRGPGVIYPLQGIVAAGEALAVLAWNNDEENVWYLVVTEDQRIGWIAATVVQPDEAAALAGVPPAATLPPTPFPTGTPTATPSPTVGVVTVTPTDDSGDLGGDGNGGATRPPEQPTDSPTEPPDPPTATPPPFGTQEP